MTKAHKKSVQLWWKITFSEDNHSVCLKGTLSDLKKKMDLNGCWGLVRFSIHPIQLDSYHNNPNNKVWQPKKNPCYAHAIDLDNEGNGYRSPLNSEWY